MVTSEDRITSSFRDPDGYLFKKDGEIYRKVSISYKRNYDKLISSQLYDFLVSKGLLVPHVEISHEDAEAYRIIKPTFINFITYPYEWCFSQLLDAALLTLEIQEQALLHGMTLKDASAFNVAFQNSKPIFIDSLSFESYQKDQPWIAYGQFCRHFLGPLLLMKYRNNGLIKLLHQYIDGIPLELVSNLMPWTSFFNSNILLHIHLHSRAIKSYQSSSKSTRSVKMSLEKQHLLIKNLKAFISSIATNSRTDNSHWKEYYSTNSYSSVEMDAKIQYCTSYIKNLEYKSVWDIGCNTGLISEISASNGACTLALDNDHASIETLYKKNRGCGLALYPVWIELTNPSSNCGWAGEERMSLNERGPADMVFALALIHHLVISNNTPLAMVARWLHQIAKKYLIIEFVPKTDIQVEKLLMHRIDIFHDYNREVFEEVFNQFFETMNVNEIGNSGRVLFLMKPR